MTRNQQVAWRASQMTLAVGTSLSSQELACYLIGVDRMMGRGLYTAGWRVMDVTLPLALTGGLRRRKESKDPRRMIAA